MRETTRSARQGTASAATGSPGPQTPPGPRARVPAPAPLPPPPAPHHGEAEEARLGAALAERHDGRGLDRIRTLLWPAMERIESQHGSGGGMVTGVPTGFTDLDERTAGFQAQDLVVIAARPSMGKTALCLNIAQHVAIEKGLGVAIFSLEMSKDALVQRMICSEARVDAHRVRT